MNRTVLFLPQNDSHAETTVLIDREISRRGLQSIALDMDGAYHQGTAVHLRGMNVRPSGLVSERPFYRIGFLDQMRLVARARKSVRQWLTDIDAVVAFNDGALQRLVLTEARKRGLPTDLVLDGMITYLDEPISPRSGVRRVLRWLGRRLHGSVAGAFLPSEVGLFPVDRTHVAGEHSAEVLRSRGSQARQILASGLPRWPDPESNAPHRVVNVLYLTGAFRWHGDQAMAAAQEEDVAELADACQEVGLSLTIRIHPRDDRDPYLDVRASILDARSEPISASIRRSDLVLSIVSTGLVEAVLLGKPSRVLAIHARWSRYRRAFVADPIFGAIRSIEQLRSELGRLATSVELAALAEQRQGIARYVAATGPSATTRIAATIGQAP